MKRLLLKDRVVNYLKTVRKDAHNKKRMDRIIIAISSKEIPDIHTSSAKVAAFILTLWYYIPELKAADPQGKKLKTLCEYCLKLPTIKAPKR